MGEERSRAPEGRRATSGSLDVRPGEVVADEQEGMARDPGGGVAGTVADVEGRWMSPIVLNSPPGIT